MKLTEIDLRLVGADGVVHEVSLPVDVKFRAPRTAVLTVDRETLAEAVAVARGDTVVDG